MLKMAKKKKKKKNETAKMHIKCYAYIDLCQEIEPKVSRRTAGTLVPI